MDKEDFILFSHTHNGILLSHKNKLNNAIYSNMDGTRDYDIKWIKAERERQIPYNITSMRNLKHSTQEPIYKTEIDSDIENRLVVAKVERWWG